MPAYLSQTALPALLDLPERERERERASPERASVYRLRLVDKFVVQLTEDRYFIPFIPGTFSKYRRLHVSYAILSPLAGQKNMCVPTDTRMCSIKYVYSNLRVNFIHCVRKF